MIVEFTGPPGSGKSTLASFVIERVRERGASVVEGREILPIYLKSGPLALLVRSLLPASRVDHRRLRLYQQIDHPLLLPRFAARHPRGFRLFRSELERIRAEAPEEHARIERWVERGIHRFVMARARSARLDLVVCDEGICHRCINLFVGWQQELDLARLRGFLACWALPDMVVQVTASLEHCTERIRARGGLKRLEGKGNAELRAFVEECAVASAEIAREARRRGRPTVEIANDHPSAEEFLASSQCSGLVERLLEH